MAVQPPPGAVLSPDGRYWWNGERWTPVGVAPPPPQPQQPEHPGFWARHRLNVAEKHYEAQLAEWQHHVDGLTEYLRLVDDFAGLSEAEGLVLKPGETVFGQVTGAALVESRVQGGRFVSGFAGEQYALPEAAEQLSLTRRLPRTGERVTISATDPLNLVGVIVPGDTVPAVRTNRITYVDGVPEAPGGAAGSPLASAG